jgi:toxin YoeB
LTAPKRDAVFDPIFLKDLDFWIETDRRLAQRILRLVDDVLRDPFMGIGKPEKVRWLQNTWSRRINEEHRLVYRVFDDRIYFLQARYHYKK